jgi:hypothetical protein
MKISSKSVAIPVLSILIFMPCLCMMSVRGSEEKVKVGAYYYVWYAEGNGSRHWNDITNNTVIDLPVLGYYSSQNESVIKQHLDWMKDIGLDYLIISWWGPNSYEDNSTKALFNLTESYAPWMKLAIMVEGFNDRFGPDAYNFTGIYEYVYNTYVLPYGDIYLDLNGKPVVCWFNFVNMTVPLANRERIRSPYVDVEVRIIGQSSYVDWWFAMPYSQDSNSMIGVFSNDSMVCVQPRYDDTHLGWGHHSFDSTYFEDLYDSQWLQAIDFAKDDKCKMVSIYSWNEFHERSQIEPCFDNTSYKAGSTTLILDKTRSYITQIKSLEQNSILPYVYLTVGLSAGIGLTTAIYFAHRKTKSKK